MIFNISHRNNKRLCLVSLSWLLKGVWEFVKSNSQTQMRKFKNCLLHQLNRLKRLLQKMSKLFWFGTNWFLKNSIDEIHKSQHWVNWFHLRWRLKFVWRIAKPFQLKTTIPRWRNKRNLIVNERTKNRASNLCAPIHFLKVKSSLLNSKDTPIGQRGWAI